MCRTRWRRAEKRTGLECAPRRRAAARPRAGEHCLTKDRRARVPDASVIRFLIDEASTPTARPETADAARPTRPWLAAIGAAIALTAAATAVLMRPARPSPPAPLTRSPSSSPPSRHSCAASRSLRTAGRSSTPRINGCDLPNDLRRRPARDRWHRRFDGPVLLADGKWVGFFSGAEAKLKKVALTGGAPVTICDMAGALRGTMWTRDNQILLASDGIKRVPANGGVLETLIAPKPGEVMQGPQLLPDGDHIVFAIGANVGLNWDAARIVVQSLKTGERKILVEGGSDPRVVPGHLLYALGFRCWRCRSTPRVWR